VDGLRLLAVGVVPVIRRRERVHVRDVFGRRVRLGMGLGVEVVAVALVIVVS
jgi:hypothetical protein